eukprot:jgi/Chrzof1/4185/Cz14g02050.t1
MFPLLTNHNLHHHQGLWCQVDLTKCPDNLLAVRNFTDGRGQTIPYDRCLPAGQRQRTANGCLCRPSWSMLVGVYGDTVDLDTIEDIVPWDATELPVKGSYQGTCNITINSPGGAWCFVTPGTCTTLPLKILSQTSIDSDDLSVVDYCGDPAHDEERAAQSGGMTSALIARAQRDGVRFKTQAGCTCSPMNWTHYEVDGSFGGYHLGCANPDKEAKGAWCPVDPRTCPSYFAAALVEGHKVPGHKKFEYWYDWCGPVRTTTEAGCLCMADWYAGVERFWGGVCANSAGNYHKERPWCYVDYLTCKHEPAGATDASRELHWDYCPQATAEAGSAATASSAAASVKQHADAKTHSQKGGSASAGKGLVFAGSNGGGHGSLKIAAKVVPAVVVPVTVVAAVAAAAWYYQRKKRRGAGYEAVADYEMSSSAANPMARLLAPAATANDVAV